MTTTKIEILRGPDGLAVAIDGTRVAGPKAWGGGTAEAAWDIPQQRVLDAMGFDGLRARLGLTGASESKPSSPECLAGASWADEYARMKPPTAPREFFDKRFSACKGDYDHTETFIAYKFRLDELGIV